MGEQGELRAVGGVLRVTGLLDIKKPRQRIVVKRCSGTKALVEADFQRSGPYHVRPALRPGFHWPIGLGFGRIYIINRTNTWTLCYVTKSVRGLDRIRSYSTNYMLATWNERLRA
jgi:hypothetical protein